MPKVKITKKNGIIQEKGSGLTVEGKTVLNGAIASIRRKVITWAADKTLATTDSGALVFCDQQTAAIDLELPTAAAAGAGWFIDVYLRTASSAAANIDMQADGNNVFIHLADGGTDSVADTTELKRTVTFTANATVNSKYKITSTGSKYYVRGFSGTTNEMAIADTGV